MNIYFSASQSNTGDLRIGAYVEKSSEDEVLPIKYITFDRRIASSYIALKLILEFLLENNITNNIRIHHHELTMIKLLNSISTINIKADSLLAIKSILERFTNVEFVFVKREDNIKAINLAKKTIV